MNIREIKGKAKNYIEENKIERNSYQVEKAFIDGAKMVVKTLNLAYIIVPVCDHKEYRWMQEAGKEFDECVNCGHRKQTKL